MKIPHNLLSITPYIKCADELDRVNSNAEVAHEMYTVVSYYCRLYALGISYELVQQDETNASKSYVVHLLTMCETIKETTSVDKFTKEEAKSMIFRTAECLLKKAEEVESTKSPKELVGNSFQQAVYYFEILQQFDELDEDVSKKLNYARFMVHEILNPVTSGSKSAAIGLNSHSSLEDQNAAADLAKKFASIHDSVSHGGANDNDAKSTSTSSSSKNNIIPSIPVTIADKTTPNQNTSLGKIDSDSSDRYAIPIIESNNKMYNPLQHTLMALDMLQGHKDLKAVIFHLEEAVMSLKQLKK